MVFMRKTAWRVSPYMALVSLLGACVDGDRHGSPGPDDSCACPVESSKTLTMSSLECYCAKVGCPESEAVVTGWERFECGEEMLYRKSYLDATDIVIFRTDVVIGAFRAAFDPIVCGARYIEAGDTSCLDQWPEARDLGFVDYWPPANPEEDCDDSAGGAAGAGGAGVKCGEIVR